MRCLPLSVSKELVLCEDFTSTNVEKNIEAIRSAFFLSPFLVHLPSTEYPVPCSYCSSKMGDVSRLFFGRVPDAIPGGSRKEDQCIWSNSLRLLVAAGCSNILRCHLVHYGSLWYTMIIILTHDDISWCMSSVASSLSETDIFCWNVSNDSIKRHHPTRQQGPVMMHLASTFSALISILLIGKALGYAQQQYHMQVGAAFDRPHVESAMMDPIHSVSRIYSAFSLSAASEQMKCRTNCKSTNYSHSHGNFRRHFVSMLISHCFRSAFALFWLSPKVPHNNLWQNLCIPSISFVNWFPMVSRIFFNSMQQCQQCNILIILRDFLVEISWEGLIDNVQSQNSRSICQGLSHLRVGGWAKRLADVGPQFMVQF